MNVPCFECGQPAEEEHHVVPALRGGKRTVPLCAIHHAAIHEKGVLSSMLTREGLAKKKERGERLGRPPFGWKVDFNTGMLVEIPEQQEALVRARELHAQGISIREVVKRVSTPETRLTYGTLHRTLKSPRPDPNRWSPPKPKVRVKGKPYFKDIVALAEIRGFLGEVSKEARTRIIRFLADEFLPERRPKEPPDAPGEPV